MLLRARSACVVAYYDSSLGQRLTRKQRGSQQGGVGRRSRRSCGGPVVTTLEHRLRTRLETHGASEVVAAFIRTRSRSLC
ncbi:hypothetical protein MRX96_025254 [Rhipicephalus microplus]